MTMPTASYDVESDGGLLLFADEAVGLASYFRLPSPYCREPLFQGGHP